MPEQTLVGLEGGCQCGQVRYRLNAAPLTLYICHCLDCQKQSSSAFGMSLWVPTEAFELLGGEPKTWETAGDSGSPKICAFCDRCGSRIYHASAEDPATLSIKAGSLDDTSWLRPQAQLWTRRAQPWLNFDTDLELSFADEPDSDESLLEVWRDRSNQA